MFDYILHLLGLMSTDSIVAGFNRTQRRLERHANRAINKSARHDRKASRHGAKAHNARQDAHRADNVSRKIAELVG